MTLYTGQRTIMLEYKASDILKELSQEYSLPLGQPTMDKNLSYKTQDSTDGIIQQLKIPDK